MIEEYKDINRRVALALGWSGLEDEEAYTKEAWPDGLPIGEAREACISYSGWFGWEPGAGEDFDKKPVPDFCRDPAAADLVRLEVERRGWDWCIQSNQWSRFPGRYSCMVSDSDREGLLAREQWGEFPHHALCLAFLAADEARKAAP